MDGWMVEWSGIELYRIECFGRQSCWCSAEKL